MKTHKEKILVVDDAPHNLRLLVSLLSQAYEVIVASDGVVALETAVEQLPDLILLDVMMPDVNGFEVCTQLKANAKTSHIPVIFLTVFDKLSDKMTAFNAGGVDYITKPFQTREVLARVETHLTIRRLQKRLEAQVAELDAFAHTVAHDLKSPLWLMTGFAEALLTDFADEMPEGMAGYLESINRAGQTGVKIVEELLLLASVQKKEVELTAVAMPTILHQAIDRFHQLFPDHQPTIVQQDEWPEVLGYAPWLEEVWVNYLTNAVKYGGTPPQISCGMTRLEGDKIKFWVQDNGSGISEADQKNLFTEFSQLQPTRRQGHGLGLSIVQRIIRRLEGEVGVESQANEGSCFFFILPLAKLAQDVLKVDEPTEEVNNID